MRLGVLLRASAPLLLASLVGCSRGTSGAPTKTAEDADLEEVSEEPEEPQPEEDEAPEPPEPPFANEARQSVRATEAPKNPLRLELVVAQRGADLPWLVVIAQGPDASSKVAADLRLLRLEIEEPPAEGQGAPGRAKKPETHVCELPKADRPSKPDEDLLVTLEPGFLLAQTFDPRLFCEPEWLVPGAVVTPKFGWAPATKTVWRQGKRVEEPIAQTEPFAAVSPEAGEDALAPVKELVGEPFTLDESYASPPPPAPGDDPPPLELYVKSLGTLSDPQSTNIQIEIKNPARQGRHLFFRRELVTYEVIGPTGTTTCSIYPDDRVPTKQAFDYIGPGGSLRVASRLAEICAPGTFTTPGLYKIHARLDATHSGREQGLDAFVGVVTSREPGLLRLRGGKPAPMWLLSAQPPRK